MSFTVWKGCQRLGTRDWYLMHYSNPSVTGGQKHTHTHSRKKITYAHEPVPLGATLAKLLMDNLQAHTSPDKSLFKTKAIQWYCNLLLNQNGEVNNMIGAENGILFAYGMCPPCEPPCSATQTKNFLIMLLLSLSWTRHINLIIVSNDYQTSMLFS